MYILDKIENELGFSIGFDEKEKKFKLSNQSEKQLSKTNLDSIIYKINIYDKENKVYVSEGIAEDFTSDFDTEVVKKE